jgi:hypothetical protein
LGHEHDRDRPQLRRGRSVRGRRRGRHTMVTDEPKRLGGTDAGRRRTSCSQRCSPPASRR